MIPNDSWKEVLTLLRKIYNSNSFFNMKKIWAFLCGHGDLFETDLRLLDHGSYHFVYMSTYALVATARQQERVG
jgi:hypothetical protein